jgi:hypothetical protein
MSGRDAPTSRRLTNLSSADARRITPYCSGDRLRLGAMPMSDPVALTGTFPAKFWTGVPFQFNALGGDRVGLRELKPKSPALW